LGGDPIFRATFLGWQSWLLQSDTACLLVDPLLTDDAGRGVPSARQTFLFSPPRHFEWEGFPSVDAILLSHEHEDHFSIPSLSRISRSIPIYLSARSSVAAFTVLAEMGFTVLPLYPGAGPRVGDLKIRVFSPNHVGFEQGDEWDTLGYSIQQHGCHFFSNVDIELTAEIKSYLRERASADGPATLLYQAFSLFVLREAVPVIHQSATSHVASDGANPADADALALLRSGRRIRPLPGQTAVFDGGRLVAVERGTSFLTTPPQSRWPPRPRYEPAKISAADPVCGEKLMGVKALPELEQGLAEIADFMYGRQIFRRLYSLRARQLGVRKPTLVWILMADDRVGDFGYEYNPQSASFDSVELDAPFAETYAGIAVCWATDLLALLRGDFEPRVIVRSYVERWMASCDGVSFLRDVLWVFFHPLRRPMQCLRQYRSLAAALAQPPGTGLVY